MRDCTTVWLIRRFGIGNRAEYMHEVAQMAFEWSADATRARRFKRRGEAERFGTNVLCNAFHAIEMPLRDLVQTAEDHMVLDEVDLLDA